MNTVKEEKERKREERKYAVKVVAMVVAVALVGAAAALGYYLSNNKLGGRGSPVPTHRPNITAVATGRFTFSTPTEQPPAETPTPTPTPTATPSPTPTETPTPTPEIETPCVVVPDEYCSQAEIVIYQDMRGNPITLVGFNLPPGVPIYASFDAEFYFPGKGIYNNPEVETITLYTKKDVEKSPVNLFIGGQIRYVENPGGGRGNIQVRQGEIIGYTAEGRGAKMDGVHTVAFGFFKYNPEQNGFVDDEEATRSFFPWLFPNQ